MVSLRLGAAETLEGDSDVVEGTVGRETTEAGEKDPC